MTRDAGAVSSHRVRRGPRQIGAQVDGIEQLVACGLGVGLLPRNADVESKRPGLTGQRTVRRHGRVALQFARFCHICAGATEEPSNPCHLSPSSQRLATSRRSRATLQYSMTVEQRSDANPDTRENGYFSASAVRDLGTSITVDPRERESPETHADPNRLDLSKTLLTLLLSVFDPESCRCQFAILET